MPDSKSVFSPAVRRELDGPPSYPGEIWKLSPTYPTVEVSDLGRVRNRSTKAVLHQTQEKRGYRMIQFRSLDRWLKMRVHILVADAFLYQRHPLSMLRVLHRDLNPGNNVPSNLQYATGSEIAEYYHLLAHAVASGASSPANLLPPHEMVATPDGVLAADEPHAAEVLAHYGAAAPSAPTPVDSPPDGGSLYPSDEEAAAILAEVAAVYRRGLAPLDPPTADPSRPNFG